MSLQVPADSVPPTPPKAGVARWRSTIMRLGIPILAIAFFVWLVRPTPIPIPAPNLSQAYSEVAEVIHESRAVLVSHPDSAESWGDYGLVLAAHEFTNDALLCLAHAADLEPRDPRWPYFRGHLIQTRQPRLAATEFARAAEQTTPDHAAFALTRAAESYLMAEDVAAAQGAIEKAIAESPNHPQAAFVAARVAFARSDWPMAKEAVERANQLHPKHRDVLELYSQLLRKLGDRDRANELAAAANQLGANERAWPDPWLGQLHERRVDPHWRLHQAQKAQRAGDFDRARQLLTPLVTRHPDDPQFALSLARLEYNAGHLSESISVCSTALLQHPNSAELFAVRGSCWILKEAWAQACDDLQRATRLSPHRSTYWVDMAFALRQSQRYEDAENACLKAIKLDPNLLAAQIERIHLRLDQGQQDAAQQLFKSLEANHATKAELQRLKTRMNQTPKRD